MLRHLVAARPLAPSSSTWTQTTSGDDSSAAPQQACLLRSRATMIAPAPPVPISPISGHTGEAAWSRRDIPVAVTLGTELRGSSFGGAMKLVVRARHIPRAGSRRRYPQMVSDPCYQRACIWQVCSVDRPSGRDL